MCKKPPYGFDEQDWIDMGTEFELKVECDSNYLPHVKVWHDDGTDREVGIRRDEKFIVISSNNRFKGKVLLT